MTNRAPLDPRLMELLSAYLDGRLEGREKIELEERLMREEDLRSQLEELRTVRNMLRALPLLRPPRPLTLSPAMAGSRPQRNAIPSWPMALGSALAALAFLFLLSRDIFSGRLLSMGAAAPAAMEQQPMLEMQPPSATDQSGELNDQTASSLPAPLPTASVRAMATSLPPKATSLQPPPTLPQVAATAPAAKTSDGGEQPAASEAFTQKLGSGTISPPAPAAPPWSWEDYIPALEAALALTAIALGVLAIWNSRRRR